MRKKVFIALRMAGIAGQEKLSGIFRFLGEKHDWDITIVRTAAEFTPDRIRAALSENYDGFIVSIPDTESTAAILADSKIPTVVMDIHDPAISERKENIVFIRNSPEEIGRAAANYLLETGRCRSYAFMHDTSRSPWSTARCKTFRSVLRDRGFWCNELSSPKELIGLKRPVGIFAANDDCAYDTLEWCRTRRIKVPEDVLVLGTDNDTLICENSHPTLSSIQPDFNEEGFLAARELHRMMAVGNAKPSSSALRTSSSALRTLTLFVGVKTIVRRASTSDISHAGKLVQAALAFIRENATKRISAKDVIAHLGCSRRLADLRFRELQNSSIGETIIQTRLEEVQRLLRTTNDPIDRIAESSGFANANYLKNLFKRRFGKTMREWRKVTRGNG